MFITLNFYYFISFKNIFFNFTNFNIVFDKPNPTPSTKDTTKDTIEHPTKEVLSILQKANDENEQAKKLEVILLVRYKNKKIDRVWELTYPDWSEIPAFQEGKSN